MLTEDQEKKLYPLTNFKQFFKLAAGLLGKNQSNIINKVLNAYLVSHYYIIIYIYILIIYILY